ncbi:MAG: ABC transporter substrate-binding protein [Bacillota bacterium]|jgi:sn-glycerol 3-phosphate transport system substrate-binding protein
MSRRTLVLVLVAALLMAPIATGMAAPKKVKVVFWYSLSGKIAEAIRGLVEEFNKTHSDIEVEGIYQGSYDDSMNKLRTMILTNAPMKTRPHIVQIYDIGTKFMIDTKATVPVQKYIDRDNVNVDAFEPGILAYYTINDQLYSMPFNISTPLLYINKDMFRRAGLDPDKPPRTFDEFAECARKLTIVDKSGKVVQYGASIVIYGWFFEQFCATSNVLYANNGNGRDSIATASAFATPEGAAILDWWYSMVKEGVSLNLGKGTANTQKAFIAGQVAMTLDSTAVLNTILTGVAGQFDVGTGYLPRPRNAKGGVIPGGGTLWLMGGHPSEEEAAAWEFIKWAAEPKQQAFWHMNTGYFPVTKLAYDLPELKEHHNKYPQFATAVQQLRDTPRNRATQGALLGVFSQARQTIEDSMEQVLLGKAKSLDVLKSAAAVIDAAIVRYNESVGK